MNLKIQDVFTEKLIEINESLDCTFYNEDEELPSLEENE
jgi:hypothetical protein